MAPRSRSTTYRRLGRLKILTRRPGRARRIALLLGCVLSIALLLTRGARSRGTSSKKGKPRADVNHVSHIPSAPRTLPPPVSIARIAPHAHSPDAAHPLPDLVSNTYAARVRNAARSTFAAYSSHCLGSDDWDPAAGTCRDWAGLGVTILDVADTLFLLGLRTEYLVARAFAKDRLQRKIALNRRKVCPFEVIIRALGGMNAAHDLTGDDVWGVRARELGEALLTSFDTPTGCPEYWGDMNGAKPTAAGKTTTANAGSMQMEMRTLTAVTGDARFGDRADRCERAMLAAIPESGVVPDFFHTSVGRYLGRFATVGSGVDSFVEMLLKTWIASGKREPSLRKAFERAVEAIFNMAAVEVNGDLVLGRAPLASGGVQPVMEHLTCFFPGALALAALHGLGGGVGGAGPRDYMPRARRLMRTCFRMTRSNPHGLAPEEVTFEKGGMRLEGPQKHLLRPEIVESLFVLHTVTEGREPQYRRWGRTMWDAIEQNSTLKNGRFCATEGLEREETAHGGTLESFFLAETIKYFFLLFREEGDGPAIDLKKWVFNTEAHPVRVRTYRRAVVEGNARHGAT